MHYAITTFYKFVALSEERVGALKAELEAVGAELGVEGLILLATEGINATVSAAPDALDAFKAHLATVAELSGLHYKDSVSELRPFRRYQVAVRPEIVTAELPGVYPQSEKNNHLSPEEWHALVTQNNEPVTVIDTRNRYETKIGKFVGAIDPDLTVFSEFAAYIDNNPPPKDQKVLIYCTGGIRCEKAILSLQERGYDNVYQLDGGILKYFESYPDGGAYEGECFLFDHRVAVDSTLQPTTQYGLCPHCGDPAGVAFVCAYCKQPGRVCEKCIAACSKNCAYHLQRVR